MKIYVAAKFEEAERVQMVYRQLRALGHEITHDWTQENAEGISGEGKRRYKQICATNDLRGVRNADAVLVLNHAQLYGGAAEMGMAIALGIPVIVVGAEIRDNIFFWLPSARVQSAKSLEDAFARLDYL